MTAHRICFHLTWSTLGRRPMIDSATRVFLDEYFRKIAIQERTTIVALGFLQTHVHLLVRTQARYDLSRLVQLMKGGSSYAASGALCASAQCLTKPTLQSGKNQAPGSARRMFPTPAVWA
jgi:REP element-mobilizing transposase RayT